MAHITSFLVSRQRPPTIRLSKVSMLGLVNFIPIITWDERNYSDLSKN